MDTFCTRCGTSLGSDRTFCTACGLGITPSAPLASIAAPKVSRTRWWLLAVIFFFLLGVLLGRLFAPKCPTCPSANASNGGAGAAGTGHGRLTPGVGDAAKMSGSPLTGPADADAGGKGDTVTSDGSGKLIPHDLEGKIRAGAGGGGKPDPGDGPEERAPLLKGDEQALYGEVTSLAAGKKPYGSNDSAGWSDATQGKQSFTALDFSYDKTNLPRYPTDVSLAASSVSYMTDSKTGDRTGAYGTGAGIVTSSSFDEVIGWYRSHVAPGWQSSTLSDFSLLAKSLSGNKITQLLLGQTAEHAADQPVTTAPPNVKLSLFKPPGVAADSQNSSIMIVQEEGKPVTVYLQSQVK